MSSPEDSLHLIVEASLALAGFAGVVSALTLRSAHELPRLHRLSLVNLLAASFASLFLSLSALVMLAGGVDEALTWRFVSGVGLVVTAYFTIRSSRTIVEEVEGPGVLRSPTLMAINLPLLLVCGLQVWNAIRLAAFWPVFLLLGALFAIGCFSFTRLLFSNPEQ